MSAPSLAVQRFAALVRERTGNVVPAERYDFLEELAERRTRATGQSDAAAYLEALAGDRLAGEWAALVPLLTIKESYFFRAPQQLAALRERVLPQLVAARSEVRRLRIWSAACARGEEPGTLALLLAEERALAGWDWTVLATDVDEEALDGARRGLYGERAVAQVPPDLLERWFHRRGKLFELAPDVRERIDYRPLNLAHLPWDLPEPSYDLILLRNVLIYFRRPLQRWVVAQVGRALAADGTLFLGASETLWQLQGDLAAVDLGACFAYRHEAPGPPPTVRPPVSRGGTGAAVSPDPVAPRPTPAKPRPAPVAYRPPLRPLPLPAPVGEVEKPAPPGAPEQLRRAARDLAANRLAEATTTVAEVLAAAPADPAAHALDGFLRDLAGQTQEAVAAYRAALYLDPSLVQIRTLLADGLLRLGHRDLAETQHREVLAALAGGRARTLDDFADLPLPSPERAARRAREVLGRG